MVSLQDLTVNSGRLWSSIMSMARIGETPRGGCNRQALTDEDKVARDFLVRAGADTGCTVQVDRVGNIFLRREGTLPASEPVLIGSHLDTQPTGGRFDGVFGVMAGLEVLRTLAEHDVKLGRPIEVVDWTNEEGCRFAPAMLGSGVVAGAYSLEYAYDRTDRGGRRFGDELERIGYRGDAPASARRFRAAFEPHIEQGPILEKAGADIGVVTGIQGAYWFDVTLEGVPCHAGTTPMAARRDPWRAACPIIDWALASAAFREPWGRATVGDLKVSPGSRNTVPERLTISVDLRHPDADVLEQMVEGFRQHVASQAAAHGITESISTVWHMPATSFDTRLGELVAKAADALKLKHMPIVSGAGHDSLHVARYAPTAMIFVPCAGGLSHNEREAASPRDLAAGANVLLQAVVSLADA
jgi:beta-ureidopropionase / N-carbamoyl-L-amino-acid hydrolase